LVGQRFPWGNSISESQANYNADPAGYSYDLGPYTGLNTNFDGGFSNNISPVGSFAPNGYGLYDMAGNVQEWCWDWYGVPYGQPTTNNPTGPAGPSELTPNRLLRGGAWFWTANFLRCSMRVSNLPQNANKDTGFRCVRGL
jgi:formylglycine-generating enzyme required for sulfatase activity